MSFKEKVCKELEGKLSDAELKLLPSSCRFIGRIVILKIPKKLLERKKIIGFAALKLFPYMHSVCIEKKISGSRREPKIEVIAGEKSTETLHTEHGCRFLLDPAKIMFSVGNKFEKERLIKMCKPNETIIDMFAGIGYWTIPIAKFCAPKKIFAIDKNKTALNYLKKNSTMNKVSARVEIFQGDCRKFSAALEGKADRIIMGWIFETEKFLPAAFQMCKKHCTIHFHRICHPNDIIKVKKKILELAKKSKCKIKFNEIHEIKSYSPRQRHWVFDIKASKS